MRIQHYGIILTIMTPEEQFMQDLVKKSQDRVKVDLEAKEKIAIEKAAKEKAEKEAHRAKLLEHLANSVRFITYYHIL